MRLAILENTTAFALICSMSTFKLLFLPFLPFEKIIRIMELIEVFELSQASTKMFHRIKIVRRKLQPIQFRITERDYGIGLQEFKDYNEEKLVTQLYFNFKEKKLKNDTITRPLNISGCNFNVNKDETDQRVRRFYGPYDFDCLHPVSKHLFALFSIPSSILSIECTKITTELFTHPMLALCCFIEVMNERSDMLTKRQLSILLEHTNSVSGIRISCQARRDFEQLKYFLNFNCSVIVWGEWITIDNLLNATGNRIMIQVHKFRERHLNIFIKNWLERNNQTFYRLRLSFGRELNWEKVLEGIEYTLWDEKRRSRYFRQTTCYADLSIDCKDGRDFEREDGKLATVFQNSKFFNMIVWHDRLH